MAADWLGGAHDDVARLRERGVDGEIADHARHEAMLRVAGREGLLQELDAERLNLIDVARPGEPAVERPDVALGGPRPDLRREKGPHGRAGRGLGGQQVDAAPAPPLLVARNRVEDGLLDLLWGGAGLDHAAGPGQDLGIVNLAGLACGVLHERRLRQTWT